MQPMRGLIELDVTEAREILAADPSLSFSAFVVASVARAAAAHPEVHAYRDWRGRLVRHRYVDVATIVEVPTATGTFPLAHVLEDADTRRVDDLTAELRAVKADPSRSGAGRWLDRAAPALARVPGVVPAMYAVMGRSVTARRRTGTVEVSAVGMFAGGGGFAIAPMAIASLQVVVGGTSRRPWSLGHRVELRDVLQLTVTIDHDIVDGAPAARFGAALRQLIEGADVLRSERT